MAYKDLQNFLRVLEKKDELVIIDTEVSQELEITEITDRVSKAYGKALLFTNVKGSDYPLLINAMGSYYRMSIGLGVESLDDIGYEIHKLIGIGSFLSIINILKNIQLLLRLINVFPLKSFLRGRCQQVVEKDVNLFTLPVLKCWPGDAGKFITLPLVFTKDINSNRQNVGMYRMQIIDERTTGMHWHKHKDGSEIYKGYRDKKLKMPVSVALGCDPSIIYSSTAPLPNLIDEMMLAGFLRKHNVTMVKCITNDIYVPSNAEIILEGYVDTTEDLFLEGPFGDHTGYYSLADFYPKFHVTCITHKKNAVYPTTIVGKPPMEDCYMAKATERIFLPLLKMIIPELIDLNLPFEGVFHNCAIVSIKNKYPGCPQKVMNSIWGLGQMMYTKMILVADESVDVQNVAKVLDAVLYNVRGKQDLFISKGPLDALDHSSDASFYGSRLGVDATEKNNFRDVKSSYKIISVNKQRPGQAREELSEFLKTNDCKFVVAVDRDVNTNDISTVMWKFFNNIDAERDFVIVNDRIGIDATKKLKEEGLKRDWPDAVEMSEDIKKYVSERWNEYGINL